MVELNPRAQAGVIWNFNGLLGEVRGGLSTYEQRGLPASSQPQERWFPHHPLEAVSLSSQKQPETEE
jgi:hypothetical protein